LCSFVVRVPLMPLESSSEECRQKAKEAEENAERCTDMEARRIFKLVAEEWHEIARLRERNGS
jgi:hypothetical protein